MLHTPSDELLRYLAASGRSLQACLADHVACNHALAMSLGASLREQGNFVFSFTFSLLLAS